MWGLCRPGVHGRFQGSLRGLFDMSRITTIALAVPLCLVASASAHAAGNGPYAMVVCHNPLATMGTVNCQANPGITDASSLATSLTPPAAAFTSAAIPVT